MIDYTKDKQWGIRCMAKEARPNLHELTIKLCAILFYYNNYAVAIAAI